MTSGRPRLPSVELQIIASKLDDIKASLVRQDQTLDDHGETIAGIRINVATIDRDLANLKAETMLRFDAAAKAEEVVVLQVKLDAIEKNKTSLSEYRRQIWLALLVGAVGCIGSVIAWIRGTPAP